MISKQLFVLLACVFVAMIGLGITMPVLPFYVERLALAEGVSSQRVVIHVGLLTGVYALGQLLFAPVWGRWSDRAGRKPLILIGIAGYVIAQVLFGLATSLWLLYAARIVGGILSSATLPVSAAYVADTTTDAERGRGMAWLGRPRISASSSVRRSAARCLAKAELGRYDAVLHLRTPALDQGYNHQTPCGPRRRRWLLKWMRASRPHGRYIHGGSWLNRRPTFSIKRRVHSRF